MASLADIAAVRRTGPLIDLQTNRPEVLDAIGSGAIEITDDRFHFRARSASEAAAWLLRGTHDNALGHELQTRRSGSMDLPRLFGLNRLLGFRGQRENYPTIIPSLFRKPEAERKLHLRAGGWYSTAISAWHNSHFRYTDGEFDKLGVERESATGVAQHYGIATDLVDWTWDPLVAVTFAISVSSPGEMASVFIRPFGPSNEPHKAYNVFLPPSLAGRVWRQRGFFSWQPVIPQHFDSPEMRMIDGGYARYRSQASNHYRVSFPVQSEDIDWAKPNLTALYREDFWQLLDLVDWCLDAAATIEYTPRYVGWREGDFITECDRLMLQPPKLFTMPPPDTAIRENVAEMMDYLEMMALRRRPIGGRLAYHKPALQTALVAFPRKSFPMVKVSDAAIRDERAAVLPPNPLRLSRWSEELEKFDPEQDLRAPSDAFFVETRAEQ